MLVSPMFSYVTEFYVFPFWIIHNQIRRSRTAQDKAILCVHTVIQLHLDWVPHHSRNITVNS
jgi:hypothetical protein